MFSYLAQDKKKKEDGKTNVEEEKGKMKALKKQKDETDNLREKVVSELLRTQKNNVEKQNDDDTTDELLKVLELLERKSDECERELDAHKRLFSIMIGRGNVRGLKEEESEEKEEMRDVAQKKRNSVRLNILKDHSDKEKMEEEIMKLRAMNTQMMQLLGLDQSGDSNEKDKVSNKEEKASLAKKRWLEEEDTLDSLLEGLKKRGKKIKK
ncbi:cilia- and flagella-associated protein 263-like [Montipora capricornis]|uniref:cilia- and flagella-associated protein 263-like n=1 Tax=Montipora capricornis TaxID=246305 RepID=UPI0035F14439